MGKNHKNKHPHDNFDNAKRFLQWAYYEGGLGMIFIIFGILLILIFSITASFFSLCKITVLALGIISIFGGFYLKHKDDKKDKGSSSHLK